LAEVVRNEVVEFVSWFNGVRHDSVHCSHETFSGLTTVQGQLELLLRLG
jgi:hypothetical protein